VWDHGSVAIGRDRLGRRPDAGGAVLGFIFGLISGAALGLLLNVYVEDPWKAWRSRRRRLRRARAIRRTQGQADGSFVVGGRPTSVYLIEGDGGVVLEPPHISIHLRPTRADLDPLIAKERDRIGRSIAARRRSRPGTVAPWNSTALVALDSYWTSRTSAREDPTIHLNVLLTDYATFAATVLSLGGDEEIAAEGEAGSATIRRIFNLHRPATELQAVRHPIAQLANGVGIMLLAFTDDGMIILVRRKDSSRARPNERDTSVVEGIHSEKDASSADKIDVYQTAIRGCREELGIDVSRTDVSLLAFGVDTRYYQWNFLGMVETRRTAREVFDLHAMHAVDRWEGKIESIAADPTRVFERLQQDPIWDFGLVAIYLALCKKFGAQRVQDAAATVFGRVPRSTSRTLRRGRSRTPSGVNDDG
jgi:hypothetical protein